MKDQQKTKNQLVRELEELRQRVADLEKAETELKAIEEALRKNEDNLAEAQRIAHIGSWDFDLITNTLTWSDEVYRMFGLEPQQFGATYEAFLDNIHPDDRDMVNKAYTESVKNKTPYDIVHRLLLKDGTIKYVNERCETFYGGDGKPIRSIGTVEDITERKRAEEALRRSQQNYEDLVNTIDGIVWEADARTFQFSFVSKQAERLLGHTTDRWLTEPTFWKDYIHPDDREWAVAYCKNATAEKRAHEFEYRMIAADGHAVWLRDIVTVVIENGQPVKLRGVMVDITERKRAEETLNKLSNVVHQAEDVIFITDLNGIIEFVNPAFERISGYSAEDAIGKTPRILKSGKMSPEYYKQLWDTIRSGRSMHAEVINKRKNGEIWFYDQTIVPVKDSQGNMINLISVGRDVTDRKQAEEEIRKLNEELEQRVKERTAELEAANEELESFSYSISHDLRAPLRSIDGFSQILLEDYGGQLDDQGKDSLQRVRSSVEKMAQLIDDLLELSRVTRREIKRQAVDLSTLAEEIASELEKSQPERQVEFIIPKELVANGDSRLLRLVLENLLGNAWKFTGAKPRAKIEFGVERVSGESAYFVRDNGAGFDMAYADKLFTPFQRLHGETEFKGTGIGLASVKRIIRRHGGRVWAESKEGSGATFYFTLEQQKEE